MTQAAALVALLAALGVWVLVAHGRLVRAQNRLHDTWGALEDLLERRHDPAVALARRAQGRLGVARDAGARVERLARECRTANGPRAMAEAEAALDAEVAGLLHAATLPDTVAGFDGLVDEALARPERPTLAPGAHGLRRDGLGEGFDELALRRDGLGELFDGLDAGADSTGLEDGGGEADDLDDLPDLDQGLGEYLAEMGELPDAGSADAPLDGPDDMLRRLGKLADRAREAAGGYNAAARAMNDMVHSPHYGFVARVFGYRPVALYRLPEARGGHAGRARRV
jgi:hypothetical protein